jgi:hypothetical protein
VPWNDRPSLSWGKRIPSDGFLSHALSGIFMAVL